MDRSSSGVLIILGIGFTGRKEGIGEGSIGTPLKNLSERNTIGCETPSEHTHGRSNLIRRRIPRATGKSIPRLDKVTVGKKKGDTRRNNVRDHSKGNQRESL